MHALLWILSVPMMLALSVAHGAKVTDLYTADVLVAEKSVSVDPGLARQALKEVIVKVTGRRDVLNFPRLKPILDDPLPLVLKYSYQATNIPIQSEQGHELLAQRLQLDFSPGLVDQRLKELDVRPLGDNRPGVLVWLVEEKGGVREYLGREDDPVVLKSLKASAAKRGLPLFRPLLDMEDEGALPVSDSWGFFTDSIRQASTRYQPDSILVGRLFSQRGKWKTQWLLIWGSDVQTFDGEGSTLSAQMDDVVNTVADRLFADFVRPTGGADEEGIRLEIESVNQLADYFHITNFLKGLPAVESLAIESIDADKLTLRLKVEGSIEQLKRSISLNQRFRAQNAGQPLLLEPTQPTLNYFWQG